MSKIAITHDHRFARRTSDKDLARKLRQRFPKGWGVGRYPDQFRALTGRAKAQFRRYMKAAYTGWVETGHNTFLVYDEQGRCTGTESRYWQTGIRNAAPAA